MSNYDIKKCSVSFTPIGVSAIIGTRTIQNWGDDKANLINIENVQPEANIVKVGADGSSSTFRQYDTTNKKLTIKIKVDTPDDFFFKNIQALHEAGSDTLFTISYFDENSSEKYVSISGSLGTLPSNLRGNDMDINRTYVFNMPESIYTPPSL